jgi:uncharacterized delta-60 repeat protein
VKTRILGNAALCALVLGAGQALGAAGQLDQGFGIRGVATASPSKLGSSAAAIGIDSLGRVVLAGSATQNDVPFADPEFAVARFTSDGQLDRSFALNGVALTSFATDPHGSGNIAEALAVKLDDDDHIVAGGGVGGHVTFALTNEVFGLARFDRKGQLDRTFGSGGTVRTSFPNVNQVLSGGQIEDLALQSDGQVIAAGVSFDGSPTQHANLTLARYRADGQLDDSFSGGFTILDVGRKTRTPIVRIEPDGSVAVAAVVESDAGADQIVLARYSSDGVLDPAFGDGGTRMTSFDGSITAMKFDASGHLVVAGVSLASDSQDATLVVGRYLPDGSLDERFAGTGSARLLDARGPSSASVAVDNGGVIAVGACLGCIVHGGQTLGDRILLRLHPDGTLDTSFGAAGIAAVPLDEGARSIEFQSDGKILAAGSVVTGNLRKMAVARFLAGGDRQTIRPVRPRGSRVLPSIP